MKKNTSSKTESNNQHDSSFSFFQDEFLTEQKEAYIAATKGIPTITIIDKFKSRANKLSNDNLSIIDGLIAKGEQSLISKQKALDSFRGDKDNFIERETFSMTVEEQETLRKSEYEQFNVKANIEILDRKLSEVEGERGNYKNMIGVPKGRFQKAATILIVSTITLLLETFLGWEVYEKVLSLFPWASFIAAGLYAFLLGLSSNLAGYYIAKKKNNEAIISSVFNLILILGLFYARVVIGAQHNLFIVSTLFVISGISVLLGSLQYEDYDYYEVDDYYIELEKKYAVESSKLAMEEIKVDSLSASKASKAKSRYEQQLENYCSGVESEEANLSKLKQQKDSLKAEGEIYEASGITAINDAYERGSQSKARRAGRVYRSATKVVIGIVSMFMISCGQPDKHEYAFLRDTSLSQKKDPTTICGRIYSTIDAEQNLDSNGFSSQGVKVYLTDISNKAVPKVNVIEVMGSSHWATTNRLDRIDDLKNFKAEIKAAGQKFCSKPQQASLSQIYRSLINVHNMMDKTSKRRIIICSDFIEDSPLISLADNKYLKNVRLMRQDYDSLVVRLISDKNQKPDFRNVDFTLIHDVHGGKDELTFEAIRFFEWVITNHGGQVEIKSNI